MVVVAQLVRASVCGTEGRGFESHLLPKRQSLFRNERAFFDFINFFIFTQTLNMEKNDLLEVYKRIQPHIYNTAVLESRLLNEIACCTIFLKCENFQKAGAYKIRGATNAILKLSEKDRSRGVVTHSSGNFAQAVSLAAKNLQVPAYIVMPTNAPKIKKAGTLSYGGIVTECEATIEARERKSQKIKETTGATLLHPSNDLDVIYGQGTASYELFQQATDFDFIICPVGGGGLIAGTCLYAKHFSPNTKIIGAEPFEVDDAYRSLISGKIETNTTTNQKPKETISHALRAAARWRTLSGVIWALRGAHQGVTQGSSDDHLDIIWGKTTKKESRNNQKTMLRQPPPHTTRYKVPSPSRLP